jgi:TonB-dependent receptor
VAGNIRISSVSAVAALSLSVPVIAQQAPPADTRTEELEEVIVTGVRESLSQGLEVKREATQVVESIVAEDIGKLPDNNVIEALQRLTGIQVTNRSGGESDPGSAQGVPGGQATGFVIRGLPDSTTTWNGRAVFTGVGRAIALQDIPANLVNRIDVFKTRAADQLETGLAGQIDVRTRRPLDLPGLEFSIGARAITQEQREDSLDPNVSMLASNQWELAEGRFGALVNASYSRTRYRDQSATAGALVPFVAPTGPLPSGFIPLQRIFNPDPPASPLWEPGLDRGLPTAEGSTLNIGGTDTPYLLARDALFASDFEGDRRRPAANLALQWQPGDNSLYTFEAFYQGYREEMFNNLHFTFADWWEDLGSDPASTITTYPGTNLIKTRTVGNPFGFNSGDSTEQSTDTYVYALNGQWQVGDRLSLEADLAIQDSEFETQFIAVRTERVPESITLDFNSGNGFPSWHFNDDAEMLDANNWNVGQLFENAGRDEGGGETLSFDGDYALADEGIFRTLSFGVRYDDRDAVHFQPRNTGAVSLPAPLTLAQLPAGMAWANEDFLDGEADLPASWLVANGYYIADHADEVRALYNAPSGGPALLRSYDVQERTGSVYTQLDMQFGEKLQAQAGLRYVNVGTDLEFTDLVDPTLPETNDKSDVDDILPSVTLRYSVTDDFRLRLNYGETLRRPTFADLNPNLTLTEDLTGVGYGSGTGGNPGLEAAKGKNIDLTAEWYFAPDSAVYGTLFRRDIEGLVVPLLSEVLIPGSGLNVDRFRVVRPVNASDGELDGLEIGLVYFPEQLPDVLRGLGVQASFTKLNSSQTIPRFNETGDTIIGQDESEFFGVSDFSYNVTLAYDRSGLGARLSYVRRDNFLNNNEARLFANPIGIWREPESSLDFQLNYDVSDALAVSFDAVNITEEVQRSYYAFGDAGGPQMFNFGNTLISRSFALGMRYRFR